MGRRAVLLIVALMIALVGTGMIVMYVKGIDDRAVAGQELVEVLVATDIIEAGETVSDAQAAGKFNTSKVARDSMVDGALSSTKTIDDKVSLGTVFPGEQIISPKFGNPGQQDSLAIPPGKMAISVELTDYERIAGFVAPGSDVAVYMTLFPKAFKSDGSTTDLPSYTSMILPRVQVVGVGATTVATRTVKTEDGGQTTEEVPKTILTLAVDQSQGERLVWADRNTDLTFALLTDQSKSNIRDGVRLADVDKEALAGGTTP